MRLLYVICDNNSSLRPHLASLFFGQSVSTQPVWYIPSASKIPPNPGAVNAIISLHGDSDELGRTRMRLLHSLLNKLGLATMKVERHPIRVFLLEDDERRHRWFTSRFKGDFLDIAENVAQAQEFLSANCYDAIFLDHDLHPEHYHRDSTDDERTGYAVARWLSANPELQRAATITVHTRNADGAMRMVEELRSAGRTAEYVPFPMLAERIKSYWER